MEFAATIADSVLGRLAAYASQQVSLTWGAQLELKKLTETLTTINLLLQDAERRQVKNLLITHWLAKLKDVCYDVDDVLDELVFQKMLNKLFVKGQVRYFFSRWNPTVFKFKLGHKVKEIGERLVEIDNERRQFGLIEVTKIGEEPYKMLYNERETDSLVEALEIVGRDDDKRIILGHLVPGTSNISIKENVSVISIVGFGGLGKTTLAKLVYNDSSVHENFEVKMWVCVSDRFEIRSLILKIISAATDQKFEEESLDRIKRRLQDILKGKKFLLVLDDVWDTDYTGVTHEKWLGLKSVLSVGANGSRILVTTRNRSVGFLVNSLYMHPLEGLSHKESMSLFIKRAFNIGEHKRYPRLIEIGENIVNRCGGVPLAVATLGSMLYQNRDLDRWMSVRDDDMWSIGNHNILPALKLSYDALPPHLKPCFAFCSLFPKDYEFESISLVEQWIAHGYLKTCKRNEELDKMGMSYIRHFCSRSLFQVEDDFKTGMTFKMHDLIHDMAISVAQAEYSTVNKRPSGAFEMVRHVSISENDLVGEEKHVPDFIFKSTKLRTFLIPEDGKLNRHSVKKCISSFKCMRVLDLSGPQLEKLPNSIGSLFNLRFLDLSSNRNIRRLPRSICKLLNLEFLNFSGCTALEEIPKGIWNLINLRSLGITTKQKCFPKGISRLTSLQVLLFTGCGNLKSLGEEIQLLTNLHILRISCCENLESLPPNMNLLTTLNTLFIDECKKLDLMKTRQGPQGLRSFAISTSHLEALPYWLEDSANVLQSIAIAECKNLTQLLELQKFTLLEKLFIVRCPNMLDLPQGLHCLTELKELHITDCPKLSKRCKRQFKGEDRSKFASEAKITLDF